MALVSGIGAREVSDHLTRSRGEGRANEKLLGNAEGRQAERRPQTVGSAHRDDDVPFWVSDPGRVVGAADDQRPRALVVVRPT